MFTTAALAMARVLSPEGRLCRPDNLSESPSRVRGGRGEGLPPTIKSVCQVTVDLAPRPASAPMTG